MNSIKKARRALHAMILVSVLSGFQSLHAADAENGRLLYRQYCSQCHGLEGIGKGINAPHLEVAPRNHTDRDEMVTRTDEELFKAIAGGGQAVNKSVLMPNWEESLNDEEIEDLIAHLRVLCCENK